MKNYTLPKVGSLTWLRALKKALESSDYKTTPSKYPLDLQYSGLTTKEQSRIITARGLIDARNK